MATFQFREEKSLFRNHQLPDSSVYFPSHKFQKVQDTNGVCSPHQQEFGLHCASEDNQRSRDSFTSETGNTQEASEQLSKSNC